MMKMRSRVVKRVQIVSEALFGKWKSFGTCLGRMRLFIVKYDEFIGVVLLNSERSINTKDGFYNGAGFERVREVGIIPICMTRRFLVQ